MVEITYAEENLPGQKGSSSQVTGKENGEFTVFFFLLNLAKQITVFFYLAHKITFTINVFFNKAESEVEKENVLPLQEKEPVTGKTL